MKLKIAISVITLVVVVAIFAVPRAYKVLDENYQKTHDPIRIEHINEIAEVVFEYDEMVGYPPLHDLVFQNKKPFIALIGRSESEEDGFAKVKALNKGAMYVNSSKLEEILSKGLKKKVKLPRDPQKVPTYAPNVYIYFVDESQFCVAAHLYFATDISQPYKWEGGTFHSHAKCYSKNK